MKAAILCTLVLCLSACIGEFMNRCPAEEIQVIAEATALDGEYIQGVLYWPRVTGEGNPVAIALMNRAMDYEEVAGEPLEETLEIFSESEHGIVGSMFTVNLAEDGLLDIIIEVNFLGAYPSTFESYFTFDTDTGNRLEAEDLFREDALDELVALLDMGLQRNIEEKKQQNSVDYQEDVHIPELDQRFVREDLDRFSVMPDGMVFRHEFDFAHAIQALEPEGEIFLEWYVIEEFIDSEGPLAALVFVE